MSHSRPQALREILSHLERGEEAIAILEELYFSSKNAYALEVKEKTSQRIRDFFKFDDSE